MSRAKQLQGLDLTGHVSSMLGDVPDWALLGSPPCRAEFSWWLKVLVLFKGFDETGSWGTAIKAFGLFLELGPSFVFEGL